MKTNQYFSEKLKKSESQQQMLTSILNPQYSMLKRYKLLESKDFVKTSANSTFDTNNKLDSNKSLAKNIQERIQSEKVKTGLQKNQSFIQKNVFNQISKTPIILKNQPLTKSRHSKSMQLKELEELDLRSQIVSQKIKQPDFDQYIQNQISDRQNIDIIDQVKLKSLPQSEEKLVQLQQEEKQKQLRQNPTIHVSNLSQKFSQITPQNSEKIQFLHRRLQSDVCNDVKVIPTNGLSRNGSQKNIISNQSDMQLEFRKQFQSEKLSLKQDYKLASSFSKVQNFPNNQEIQLQEIKEKVQQKLKQFQNAQFQWLHDKNNMSMQISSLQLQLEQQIRENQYLKQKLLIINDTKHQQIYQDQKVYK